MAEAGEEFIIGYEISSMYNIRHLGGGIYCWIKVKYSIPCQRGWGVIYCWVKVKYSIPCQRGWGSNLLLSKVKYSIPCQRGWGGIYVE